MTAKRTPFSYNVGTVYHGFLTGNFYHNTLNISFCLQVSMARIEKNCYLNILYNSHSVLFNSWFIKNDPKQMTLSFSFDIIIFWYPLFRVSDMNKDDWEYWVVNSYSHRAFFCSLRPGEGDGGGGGDRNACQKTRCKLFPLSLGKGVSSTIIVKTILKLFYLSEMGRFPIYNPLSLNLTHPIPR